MHCWLHCQACFTFSFIVLRNWTLDSCEFFFFFFSENETVLKPQLIVDCLTEKKQAYRWGRFGLCAGLVSFCESSSSQLPTLSVALTLYVTHTHKWMALEQGPVIDNSVRETSEAAALQRDGQMKGEREEGLRGDWNEVTGWGLPAAVNILQPGYHVVKKAPWK